LQKYQRVFGLSIVHMDIDIVHMRMHIVHMDIVHMHIVHIVLMQNAHESAGADAHGRAQQPGRLDILSLITLERDHPP
jgi:hypothetical protein